MSHRCFACDWTPIAPSTYQEGLEYNVGIPYRLVNDPNTGRTYCNACYDAIQLTINVDRVVDESEER